MQYLFHHCFQPFKKQHQFPAVKLSFVAMSLIQSYEQQYSSVTADITHTIGKVATSQGGMKIAKTLT